MARYDGTPDPLAGFPHFYSDPDADNWPDAPVTEEPPRAEGWDASWDDSWADRWADGWADDPIEDPAESSDLSAPPAPAPETTGPFRAVSPTDWSTSYDGGPPTDSFTLSFPVPPAKAPAPSPAPDPAPAAARHAATAPAPAPAPQRTEIDLRPLEAERAAAAPQPAPKVAETSHTAAPRVRPAPEPPVTPPPVPPVTPPPVPSVEQSRWDIPPVEQSRWDIPPVEQSLWDIPAVPAGPALSGADSLTADTVLRRRRARPQSGWRKTVYSMTGGRVNFGPSRTDRHREELVAEARTPLAGCHRLAVISLKGGVGKTTTTAALGAMLADLRGDRVIAVDANPDRGTLGERVPRESGATVRHLLDARDQLHRYADVRTFTSQSATRLEVLASDSDPSVSLAFGEQDYRDTVTTLERFYNLILTDCGTGLLHSAMQGILGLANSLVVVSSASLDGARSASATLDWLEAHGFDHLAKEAVVVISSVRPGGGIVDVLQLEDHFAARCREVVTIPYDPHLEAGGVLDLRELREETRGGYYELAAAVARGFAPRPAGR